MILVIGGVSGTGKSTVGAMLARKLNLAFYDADDFHPVPNKEKMARGQPLDDEDRRPWLETLAAELSKWADQGGAVLACSALTASYRSLLSSKVRSSINWVFLTGSESLLAERLSARTGHFFDPGLLRSQLNTLEISDEVQTFDIEQRPDDIVHSILAQLESA